MVDDDLELQRLQSSGRSTSRSGSPLLATIEVVCSGDASTVLEKTKAVLEPVFQYLVSHPIDYENEPTGFDIDAEYWTQELPSWFLLRTPLDGSDLQHAMRHTEATSPVEESQWSLKAWLYWFISPYEVRHWRWFQSEVQHPDKIEIDIEVFDFCFPWEALEWVLLVSGAISATIVHVLPPSR